mgnify:CR=1 FL=1
MIKSMLWQVDAKVMDNMNDFITKNQIEKSRVISISVYNGYYWLFYWDFSEACYH